MNYVLKL